MALIVDGSTNSYANRATNTGLGIDVGSLPITFVCFLRAANAAGGSAEAHMSFGPSSVGFSTYSAASTRNIGAVYHSSAVLAGTATTEIASDAQWYLYAFTVRANNDLRIRRVESGAITGDEIATGGTYGTIDPSDPIALGARAPADSWFSGRIAHARIYPGELTDAQVLECESGEPTGVTKNEGWSCVGDVLSDSGNNDLTLQGTATVDTEDPMTAGSSDTTAPTYSVTPAIDSQTDTSITADATASDETDSTVNHYAVVTADGATVPSAAQVKAGQDSTGSAALSSGSDAGVANAAEGSITLTGLSASTAYDVHYVVEDQSGNLTTVTSLNATTAAAPEIAFTALKDQDGQEVPVSTTINYRWYPDSAGTGTQDIDNLNATAESGSQATSAAGTVTFSGLTSGGGLLLLQWTRAGDSKIHRHAGRYTAA